MKVISKFILNRDDKQFWYVEKAKLSKKSNRTRYFVHSTPKSVIEYSDHNFHSTYCLDEKISVARFTKKAINNLLTELYDNENELGYNLLMDVHRRVSKDSNQLNPNLKKVKPNLLNGISIYNNALNDLDVIEIPYEENYRLVSEDKSYTNVREKVESINSLVPTKTDEEELERIYVTPVRELVRTRKAA